MIMYVHAFDTMLLAKECFAIESILITNHKTDMR